ncbi:MAG: carboxypeptidase regulatory-like domain-containing protein, partial [Acidobacteria bacterium]|nr:carboxypeptidase regulatory-like domain-containing protein [Acidobacteriota bacterium]
RGPSAGGSGQDNIYKFDGVNVTMPLYGTLSAEPASHDIAQVTTIRGGAKAVDFDRSGGFSIDSVSKSGTNKYQGMLGYQFQNASMSAKLTSGSLSKYEKNGTWVTANFGGPILKNKIFFYASYYRPGFTRVNRANLYGDLPKYESTRNEGFGKVTYTPTGSILLNGSWRQSHTLETSSSFGSATTATAGAGSESWMKVGTFDASWVINSRSFASIKYTHYQNPTKGRADNTSAAVPTLSSGTKLDINALDTLGAFNVPTPVAGATAFNAFIQPLIDRYGYTSNGVKTGGGTVGFASTLGDADDFFRDAAQLGYNITLGSKVRHDLHGGLQFSRDAEDLNRSSNGWGVINVPGGRSASIGLPGQPAYYYAEYLMRSTGSRLGIRGEFKSLSFEANDTIVWKDWSFNLGAIMSRDTLYGQGLKDDSSTLTGYVLSPGSKYTMYKIPFSKMIQPRLGTTWAYNGQDTIYASFARYNPAVNSLPRAASWDRSVQNAFVDVYFDQTGTAYGYKFVESSSGKLFVDDMTPRRTDEFLVGTSKQFKPGLSGLAYFRYRKAAHFWEDTNNTARTAFTPPATIGPDDVPIPKELYITDLSARLAQIGSGSSYVIAELDGAYTKYYELTLESEWRGKKAYIRGSYTRSHYWGNFDQDNSTTGNDANIFIGSSNMGDGAGRQLWDFKDGTLRGDRPNMFKVYGYCQLNWNASFGAYAFAQSGQPWEKWSYEPYIALTTSTSDANRYAEPAGSRRSPAHYQLDLNYTQNVRFATRYNVQVSVDLFNVFNKQTGYNINPAAHSSTFGTPRSYYDPRRVQVAARFRF